MAKYDDMSETEEIPMDLGPMDEDSEDIRDFMRDQGIPGPGSKNQGVMGAAENTEMAGMGKVMKMFETPYGFDRDGFEENYIQFMDYKDGGGDMGIVEFTLNAFDMVKGKEKESSIKMASETPDEEAELMLMMEEFQKQEELKKQLEKDKDREQAMYGGSMRAKYNDGTPLPMKKKYNFMELVDSSNDALDEERLDRKYNAKNYPPSQRNMSMEELKKMLDKAKKDKEKKAKGGIAGVL